MANIWSNIWYFTRRLSGYGVLLGIMFGTFIFPLYGTIVGGIWGLVAGLILGPLLGIGATVYDRFFVQADTDAATYQKNLTYGIGLTTLVLTAIPLLILYAPVAAITSAYVAHRYAERRSPLAGKRKNEDILTNTRRKGVVGQFVKQTMWKSRWLIGLAAIGGVVFNLVELNTSVWRTFTVLGTTTSSIAVFIGVVIYGIVITAMIGLVNGMFVNFLNHLHFAPDMPKRTYKRQLVVMVTLLTLIMSVVVTGFVGAPLMAIVGGLAAAAYAEWYYDGEEKSKRDNQHKRLLDAAGDEYFIVDETEDEWALYEEQ